MKDLAINLSGTDMDMVTTTGKPRKNDLRFEKFDLVLVDNLEQIRQKATIRLQFFYGEWYLDITKGLKLYEDILIVNPVLSRIQAILKAAITETLGVNELLSFDVSFDKLARSFTIAFTASTNYGNFSTEITLP